MASHGKRQSASEKLYRMGGSDPRSGTERLAGVVNRSVASKAVKKQDRRWDDSPSKMARNIAEADKDRARRGVTSRSPSKRKGK